MVGEFGLHDRSLGHSHEGNTHGDRKGNFKLSFVQGDTSVVGGSMGEASKTGR